MPVILDEILRSKIGEVSAAKRRLSPEAIRSRLADLPETRGFERELRRVGRAGTAIISEVKKGSPSKGIIRADFDPVEIARRYRQGGAACLSVLTDQEFFFGDPAYLEQIRATVDMPLLRKDFVIDAYQIDEARLWGADAVLLIAAALDDDALADFAGRAAEIGLDVLLEVHDEEELERALKLPATMIGINNRDLRTFVTDLAVTERLLASMPPDRLVVAESGISSREDILRLQDAGAGAFLIGESLMREDDIEGKLRHLLGNGQGSPRISP